MTKCQVWLPPPYNAFQNCSGSPGAFKLQDMVSAWFCGILFMYIFMSILILNYNCHTKITWLPEGTEVNSYTLDMLSLNVFSLSEQQEALLSLWGWLNTGTACQDRLWCLHSWRYSRVLWTHFWAACSQWPCLHMHLDKMTF